MIGLIMGHDFLIFFFFACLVNVDWILDIVNFVLLVLDICIPLNLDFCPGM